MEVSRRPGDVDANSCFWSKCLPDTQMTLDLGLPNRVYVLGCGDFRYVGIEYKSKVGERIRDHFAGRGSHYSKHHKPKEVLGIWTVQHTAAEAYIFALLLSTMGVGSIHRLGGYTQTSVTPSPLCKQQYEEQRRLLKNLCFRCGGNHWAKQCQKPVQGVEYKCPTCSQRILISSRGQSVVSCSGSIQTGVACALPGAAVHLASEAAPPPPQVRPSVVPDQPAIRVAKRRLALSPAESPAGKAAKTSEHAGKTVLVCGQKYTATSWYTGDANPPPKLCQRMRSECSDRAVELKNGDLRSLVQAKYARVDSPKELLPGRQNLSRDWLTTSLQCDKQALQLRLAGANLKSSRQVLFLLSKVEQLGIKRAARR